MGSFQMFSKVGAIRSMLVVLGWLLLTSAISAVTINKPMYKGAPLDYCLDGGTDCGKAAADLYCNNVGYTESINQKGPVEVKSGKTRHADTDIICDTSTDSCETFSSINCSQRFDAPMWKKKWPLDWCLDLGTDCGQPAAKYFCQHQKKEQDKKLGQLGGVLEFDGPDYVQGGTTMFAKSGQECDNNDYNAPPDGCNTFFYIVCV